MLCVCVHVQMMMCVVYVGVMCGVCGVWCVCVRARGKCVVA